MTRLWIVLLAGTALFAQRPHFIAGQPGTRPGAMLRPPAGEVKAYLSLSDAQMQSIEQIRPQGGESLRTVMEQMHQKHQALSEALKTNKDAATVGQLMLDVQALRKREQELQKNLHEQAVNLLTADQKAKLAKLEEAAKLSQTIEQATMLNLIARPEPAEGDVLFFSPFGMGPGPGPMMFNIRVPPPHAQ